MKYWFLIICFEVSAFFALAQPENNPVSAILQLAGDQMGVMVQKEAGDLPFSLLHGRRFQAQHPFVKGSPFWFQGVWVNGNIQTRYYTYFNQPVQYDAREDALVYYPDSLSLEMVKINPEDMVAFSVSDVVFIYLGNGPEKKEMEKVRLSPGYFELFYQGKTTLLAKRTKTLLVAHDSRDSYGSFAARTRWYILNDGIFYPAENKAGILSLFPTHKPEAKAYWRTNQTGNWKRNPQLLADFLAYCDQL
ncbi:MAG: hypothetical protein R3C61_08750 [Bacteroidia bacterium]